MDKTALAPIELWMAVNGREQRVTALNVGLTVFLPIPFKEYAPAMARLFSAYVAYVPRTTFLWQNLTGTSAGYKPIAKTAFSTIDGFLSLRKKYGSGCSIWLKDGQSCEDAGDSLFSLYGRDAGDDDADSNYLQVHLPHDDAMAGQATKVVSLAHELLADVPFHSAYLGYTLGVSTLRNVSHYGREIPKRMYGAARRFRGLEVFQPHLENYEMAKFARPPSWVTFLGSAFAGRLGGADGLRRELGEGRFTIRELAHGVSIQVGDEPVLADGNRGEDVLPEQKALAKLMAPLYSEKPAYLFSGRPHEDTVQWLRRHVSAP